MPAPEADGSIDPAKLPKTLPGYLINLTAEFTINGVTIKSGAAGKMGGELYEEMGLWSPKEGWETSVNTQPLVPIVQLVWICKAQARNKPRV